MEGSSQRLVLGQQACEAKSNEITAIPLLLERLALTGALVTIDAMGTQTKIAQAILDRGGDYLLALKDNQSSLHDEVRRYFDDKAALIHNRFETTDGDHGRIEVRRHTVSHDVDRLITARRFPGQPRFPGLRAIAMVEAQVAVTMDLAHLPGLDRQGRPAGRPCLSAVLFLLPVHDLAAFRCAVVRRKR